jgi:hypothetical protein
MTTLPESAKLARIRSLIADDAYAASFQTFGQYRSALLKALDTALAASAEPTEPVAGMVLVPRVLGLSALHNAWRRAAGKLDHATLRYVYAAMIESPPAQAEPSAQEPAGIELAVRWLEMRRDDYVHEFGSYDPETGATEYGRGAKGQAREEYVAEIEEVIEGIRALAACDVPPAGWSCSRSMGHEGPCAATPSPQDSASVAGALVAGCEVITPPGAAIRASVIHLTDAGREALTAKGVKSIPGVQAAPVAAAPDTLWADVWLRTRLAEMFHLMDEMRAALRTEGQAK